jgi:hypothetical protein
MRQFDSGISHQVFYSKYEIMNTMHLKTYIHDKVTIFFNLVLVLLAIFAVLQVVLKVDNTQSVAIIRNNTALGLSGFEKAATSSLYQFALIAVFILVFHTLFSIRIHAIKKTMSVYVLSFGIVAMIFLIVVSSAILGLHR